MYSICLLGRPDISKDGESLKISRKKSRALLFYVAAQNHPVHRQTLMEILWPDLPRQSAQQTLRTSLYGLKKEFGKALLLDDQTVGLSTFGLNTDVQVDLVEFTAKLDSAGDDISALADALTFYKGDFLQGFYLPENGAFEDWMLFERDHLRQKAVNGYAKLALLLANQGEFQQSLANLDLALAFNPLQEDLQRERIRIHFMSGDRPGAIQRYDELRKLLDKELGVPPMVETRKLYDAILDDREPVLPPAKSGFSLSSPSNKQKKVEEIPFVGREKDQQAFEQALKNGKLAFIQGEAGIGKTRFVTEFMRKSGYLALTGSGRELEHHLPYQPLHEAFRSLLVNPDWSEISGFVKRQLSLSWLAEISRLLPELNPSNEPLARQAFPPDEARLWEGVNQFLATLAIKRPVVLFLDDLQWADASTLGLLAYLARQDGSGAVYLTGAARESQPRTPLRSFLQALTRENRLFSLPLQRLQADAIRELAGYLSPKYAPALAEWLMRSSEGNPFILVELVRHARQKLFLKADGVLDLSGLSSAALVPQTVYSLVQSRLEMLSDQARRVLDAAVAAGRDFEFTVVSQVAGLSEQAALDALDELLDAGLVKAQGGQHFRVDHQLIVEVAYQDVGDLRHRFLHKKVAQVMESMHRDAPELYAGKLAWHFFEAGDVVHASRYARMAARSAAGLAAWNEAIEFYQLVLKNPAVTESYDLWAELADVYGKAGQFQLASDSYQKALDLLPDTAENVANKVRLQLGLARSLLPQAKFSEVIDLAKSVSLIAQYGSTAELLWGTALSLDGTDLIAAHQHLQAACDLWQKHPGEDLSTLAQIQFEMGSVAAQMGNLEQAVLFYRKSLDAARQSNIPYAQEQVVLAHNNLAYHLLLLEDPAAQVEALQGLKIAQEQGVLGLQPYLYSTLGEIALEAGDIDQAEKYFQEGLAMATRFNLLERVAGLTANLGLAALRRGQKEVARQYLSTALNQAQSLGTKHLVAQISIWLAPLIPTQQARKLLVEARSIAQSSGRRLLLDQIELLEKELLQD